MYSIVIRRTYSPWWGLGMIERVSLSAIEVPPYYEYASIQRIAQEYRHRYCNEEYSVSIMEGDAKHAMDTQRRQEAS